jgi:hypothetical protein
MKVEKIDPSTVPFGIKGSKSKYIKVYSGLSVLNVGEAASVKCDTPIERTRVVQCVMSATKRKTSGLHGYKFETRTCIKDRSVFYVKRLK